MHISIQSLFVFCQLSSLILSEDYWRKSYGSRMVKIKVRDGLYGWSPGHSHFDLVNVIFWPIMVVNKQHFKLFVSFLLKRHAMTAIKGGLPSKVVFQPKSSSNVINYHLVVSEVLYRLFWYQWKDRKKSYRGSRLGSAKKYS